MKQFTWPDNRRCAVSLTYDDALECHYETVAPQFESAGLRATFNLTIARGNAMENPEPWKKLAEAGHELANHTLFHPCWFAKETGKWLDSAYNLRDYTAERFKDEVRVGNWILGQIDGKKERTYGNTCHNNYIGDGDKKICLETILPEFFIAARGEHTGKPVQPADSNLYNLGTIGGDRKTCAQFQEEIEACGQSGGWLIYTIHGVGKGTHGGFVDTSEHEKLLNWLGENKETIWTAPMIEVARYIRNQQ